MNYDIPVHPQPGFFETTQAPAMTKEGVPGVVTSEGYQQIVGRPRWSQQEAEERLFPGEPRKLGQREQGRAVRKAPVRRTRKRPR